MCTLLWQTVLSQYHPCHIVQSSILQYSTWVLLFKYVEELVSILDNIVLLLEPHHCRHLLHHYPHHYYHHLKSHLVLISDHHQTLLHFHYSEIPSISSNSIFLNQHYHCFPFFRCWVVTITTIRAKPRTMGDEKYILKNHSFSSLMRK
jgi:hypothetical protein